MDSIANVFFVRVLGVHTDQEAEFDHEPTENMGRFFAVIGTRQVGVGVFQGDISSVSQDRRQRKKKRSRKIERDFFYNNEVSGHVEWN